MPIIHIHLAAKGTKLADAEVEFTQEEGFIGLTLGGFAVWTTATGPTVSFPARPWTTAKGQKRLHDLLRRTHLSSEADRDLHARILAAYAAKVDASTT